ncbi:excalibur calcium-binding domain-containing protein [Pseudoxanthomonas beigongshangi]
MWVVLAGCALGNAAWAHSGGLDRHGCHTQRSTGEYHCHRGGTAPPRARSTPATESLRLDAAPASGSRPFRNCAEARARGAAPVRRGDPGYGAHLDRDNDGIGCEPYRGR